MITQEQIEKHCVGHSISKLLYIRLDREHQAPGLECILPVGTIAQIILWPIANGSLLIGDRCVDADFPYDAATLLEDE